MKKLALVFLIAAAACGAATQKPHTGPGTAYGISTSPGGGLPGPGH